MRKVILTSFMMVFCVILSAQNYYLNGKIGNEKASFILNKVNDSVKGKVFPCPDCIPIEVEGTWNGNNISLAGSSEAGSQLSYKLKVDDNIVKGTESLWAEGEEEISIIYMTFSTQTEIVLVRPPVDQVDAVFFSDADYWDEINAYYHQRMQEEADGVALFGTVSTDSIEAANKAERKKALDNLNAKYGKKYVDALFNEGKILVGTPEGLVRDHTKSELISETQYTRTYKVSGYFRDWASTIVVSKKTKKVISVKNWTY